MLSTSSYKNCNTTKYKTCSISFDKGKDAGYTGECYLDLAPNRSFFDIWRANKEIKDEMANNEYYVDQYYLQILHGKEPEKIYNKFLYTTLLCYENNDEFCHRHIVAAWLELLLGVEIPEVKYVNGSLIKVERPTYIKPMLARIMKKYLHMGEYTSLRAYYLSKRAELYTNDAKRCKDKNLAAVFLEQASSIQVSAELAEKEYRGIARIKK